jgi:hypothetical protein
MHLDFQVAILAGGYHFSFYCHRDAHRSPRRWVVIGAILGTGTEQPPA